jgi:hypothetical protein
MAHTVAAHSVPWHTKEFIILSGKNKNDRGFSFRNCGPAAVLQSLLTGEWFLFFG